MVLQSIIRLSDRTKRELRKLKLYYRDTYDEVINRLLVEHLMNCKEVKSEDDKSNG